MPACSTDCIFFRPTVNNIPPPTVLVRTTHRVCSGVNCNQSVSDYDHNFCYRCAQPNSEEFIFHHSRCILPRGVARSAPVACDASEPDDN